MIEHDKSLILSSYCVCRSAPRSMLNMSKTPLMSRMIPSSQCVENKKAYTFSDLTTACLRANALRQHPTVIQRSAQFCGNVVDIGTHIGHEMSVVEPLLPSCSTPDMLLRKISDIFPIPTFSRKRKVFKFALCRREVWENTGIRIAHDVLETLRLASYEE